MHIIDIVQVWYRGGYQLSKRCRVAARVVHGYLQADVAYDANARVLSSMPTRAVIDVIQCLAEWIRTCGRSAASNAFNQW